MTLSNANTDGTSSHSGPVSKPLKVTIVGAGIGGLTAAIGLRRNGHIVTLLEQSRFANETGAAIHLCPNANGLLRRYGMNPGDFGSVTVLSVKDYSAKGEVLRKVDLTGPSKMWQHPWQLSHRVRLHETLKETATTAGGIGQPAELRVSSRVASVDAQNATVLLENGEKIEADLVIGADGLRSQTRSAVVGHPGEHVLSGKAAFRFLIPRHVVLSVPGTEPILEEDGQLSIWFSDDRRIVMYPCNNSELLNFVCIHPEGESQGSSEEWNKEATVEQVLKVYEGFDPRILDVIKKADPNSIKVWKLVDMKVLPTWVKGRTCLLGDAAHPFLPHQGQGGAVAIEDAVALATVFSPDTTPEEVGERLKLYENIRYERAHAIQEFSRQAGADFVDGKPQIDMMKYTAYNFGHDEFDNSTKRLEEWKEQKNPKVYRRAPFGFGITPGPRQTVQGLRQSGANQSFTTASITFRSSRTFLQNLFPTKSFRYKSPATVVTASFKSTKLDNMSWLGGKGYNHFGLYLHDVLYTKRDGSAVDGTYIPLLFENLTDPIISGREEIGMSKIFADLEEKQDDSSYHLQASWRGATFANFSIQNLQPVAQEANQGPSNNRTLLYKYVPATGEPGKADAEYPILIPGDGEVPVIEEKRASNSASITFEAQDTIKLPTLNHIVTKLAEIPIYGIVEASVVKGRGVPDLSSAQRIE